MMRRTGSTEIFSMPTASEKVTPASPVCAEAARGKSTRMATSTRASRSTIGARPTALLVRCRLMRAGAVLDETVIPLAANG